MVCGDAELDMRSLSKPVCFTGYFAVPHAPLDVFSSEVGDAVQGSGCFAPLSYA